MTATTYSEPRSDVRSRNSGAVRRATETKAFIKTSEFIVWALTVAAILIASYAKNDSFTADKGWLFVTIASAAYMISRGLAKSGSQDPYTEKRD